MAKSKGQRLRLEIGGAKVSIRLPGGSSSAAALPVEDWMPFSALELLILRLLIGKPAQSRDEVAIALDESTEGRIRGVLANMVARKVLVIEKEGYAVLVPDRLRDAVREWLGVESP